MEFTVEDYTRHYIVTALFKLMDGHEYEKISVKDIAEKLESAGRLFIGISKARRK